jgi:hypothetical protein
LTQTVPGTGEKGEELKVTRGFARNYLFANNFAKLATDELRAKYAPFAAVRNSPSWMEHTVVHLFPSHSSTQKHAHGPLETHFQPNFSKPSQV